MASLALTLLILVSGLALVLRRPRAAAVSIALALLFLLLVGTGLIPSQLVRLLQVHRPLNAEHWTGRVAIVVLGGGTVRQEPAGGVRTNTLAYARAFEGARLYRACHGAGAVCRVVVSGGDPGGNGESEAQVMKRELTAVGVAAEDILVEEKSNNTFQNAQFTSALLGSVGFDQVVLVTSGLHLKRALAYFAHFGVSASSAPADALSANAGVFPTAYHLFVADLVLHELAGIIRYHAYNRLGLNPMVSKPGSF